MIGFEQLQLDDEDSIKNTRIAEPINALDVYQNLLKTSENIYSSIQETKMELSGNGVQFMRKNLGR